MITEDYISFEIAKLLREKGFDGECMSMYVTPKPHAGMGNPNEAKIAPHGRDNHYYDGYLYQCEAPTIQIIIKWLRTKGYQIIVKHTNDNGYFANILTMDNAHPINKLFNGYNLYEEACETAIKYCLENLI